MHRKCVRRDGGLLLLIVTLDSAPSIESTGDQHVWHMTTDIVYYAWCCHKLGWRSSHASCCDCTRSNVTPTTFRRDSDRSTQHNRPDCDCCYRALDGRESIKFKMSSQENETPGQKAARLRREKRQNKAAGEERLAKIKQLNGGIAPPEEALGDPAPASVSNDPDEVDISATSYGSSRPGLTNDSTMTTDDPMQQAILRLQAQQARQRAQGAQPQSGSAASDEDPMARMMQQFMSMAGGDPSDPNNVHNTQDPMQMLSALMGAQGQNQGQSTSQSRSGPAYLWRIVHAIFAVVIAGYIAMTSTFNGSLLARTQSTFSDGDSGGLGHRLFIIFVTAELALQSTRFFLEGGQLQGSGMLASISQIAPEPWAGYVRAAGRWISILGSIFSDAMVVIFVLGVMAWWNGSAAS